MATDLVKYPAHRAASDARLAFDNAIRARTRAQCAVTDIEVRIARLVRQLSSARALLETARAVERAHHEADAQARAALKQARSDRARAQWALRKRKPAL